MDVETQSEPVLMNVLGFLLAGAAVIVAAMTAKSWSVRVRG